MIAKERITEILKAYTKKHNISASSVILEEYAEELIENGVIVPPCKVGDKVYRIAKDSKTIIEERVGEIHLEFTIDDGTGWHNVWWLKEYNIGKTVFLTKEEAEAELRKRGASNAEND